MVKGRGDARYLNLQMESASKEAMALVRWIAEETWSRVPSKRTNASRSHIVATAAFVADLLKAAEFDRSCFRPMGRSSFTGERIGYRAFKKVVDGARAAKLITVVEGSGGGTLVGEATRFRPTSALLKLAESFGIEAAEWQRHFRSIPRPAKIAEPLVLKSSSKLIGRSKRDGIRMSFDATETKPMELARQVDEINAFIAGVQIEPDSEHYAFHRIFNEGDVPGLEWNKGGRLYSMGDSYQQRKAEQRAKMRLNGEPVVEIDICASHLTILHAKLGVPLSRNSPDPYEHPSLPRHVVKTWVTMTLGYDRFHSRWSSDAIKDYREKHGGTLGKDYPIKEVREEVLKMIPLLKDWGNCSIRWGDLQFIESCAVVDTVHQLATEYGVPALPVHDSIIVPVSKEEMARSVLTANFKKHAGVDPCLVVK